jgi:hypothetical protein
MRASAHHRRASASRLSSHVSSHVMGNMRYFRIGTRCGTTTLLRHQLALSRLYCFNLFL